MGVRTVAYNWNANPEGHKSPDAPHNTIVVRADGTKGKCTCVADASNNAPGKDTLGAGVNPGPRVRSGNTSSGKVLPGPRVPGPATRRGQKGDKGTEAPKPKGKAAPKKQS